MPFNGPLNFLAIIRIFIFANFKTVKKNSFGYLLTVLYDLSEDFFLNFFISGEQNFASTGNSAFLTSPIKFYSVKQSDRNSSKIGLLIRLQLTNNTFRQVLRKKTTFPRHEYGQVAFFRIEMRSS